ncbi:hypothetical protein [Flavobacterium ginsengiterrae]|uniref:Lipocalin-like protein n=1 Tax=Flavobacterium ginsengiterrae TaxID=871695 RepID=A0ABP7GR83_9FLAO
MKKILFGLLIINLFLSCKSQDTNDNYIGTWLEVQQKENEFVIVDCDYKNESIKITQDSIVENGVMEDLKIKINHIKQENTETTLFVDKQEKVYYKFLIVDKEKGIFKCEIKNNESLIIRYFVNKTNADKIKKVKGTKADCITSEDAGDLINDSLILDSKKNILLVEGDNCISIKNRNDEQIYERCFDNCTVKIRHIKNKGLPLTIISGQNSIDIEFYKKGNDWISNSVTCYIGEDKKSKEIVISLKEFDFDNVFEQFEGIKSNE